MTLFIVLGCGFGSIAAYLIVGFGYVAPRWVTREVEESIRRCPTLAKDPAEVAEWRRDSAGLAWGPALVWPLYLLGRLVTNRIASAAPLTSHELRIENEQKAKRIAQLEKELGIGGKS